MAGPSKLVLDLQNAFNDIMNGRYDALAFEHRMYVHPIELPFYRAIFDEHRDLDEVMRLKNECMRKWIMGGKRNIEKWNLKNLVEQYTERLKSVPREYGYNTGLRVDGLKVPEVY